GGGDAGGGGDGGGAAAGTPVRGGTATVGVLGDFQSFNPVTNTHTTSNDVINYMLFTPIVQYDERLGVRPYLAESWELSDSSVTFRLRDDVKWHDGRPVTAEDVKFTFDLAKNPETASLIGSAFVSLVESATVVDPRTVRFDFSAPHTQALEDFWWAPLPKHLLEGVPPAQMAQAPFNAQPVGSGPFRFVEWRRGQSLTLQASDSFPQALGGRPQLDRVVFRVIPEATTLVTELLNGSADVIGYTLLPDQALQIQNQQGVRLEHFPGKEFTYIGWNNAREPFTDARVRRALAMSINRPQMIEGLVQGFGKPAQGMIPDWSPLNPGVQGLPFDVNGARQLLAQAGWRDSDGDGIVEKNGRPLRFTLMTNSENRMRHDIAQYLQQQFRSVGADAQVRTIEFQTMLQQHKARDYDAVVSGWGLDNFKVDPTPLFACAEARKPGSANRAGYCNPQADALITRGLSATDPAQAKAIWTQFGQILVQDQPITFLFWLEDMAGVGPRLQGVEMDARGKLVSVARWWIPENRRR
ncbi:MAG TPA: ABC transporter substrate-binding protein, partial [Longimicrobiaceae bacterium]|nr:ABC transporter substrate-binding protein [Longimicrobiaceae bacterium]